MALGIEHGEHGAARDEAAGVAHLAAHLGVERGAVEHDLDALLPAVGALHALAVDHEGEHAGPVEPLLVVPAELRRGQHVGELGPHVVEGAPGVALHVGAGALALRLHLAVEALGVDGVPGALGDLDGEVDREAEGIVQLEGGGAIEHGAVCKAAERLVEVDAASVERAREALLLRIDDTLDKGDVLEELGVGVAHELVHAVDEAPEERALDPDEAAVEDGAAQQAAQHVPAALVAR